MIHHRRNDADIGHAIISDCEKYRYALTRGPINLEDDLLPFIMLNPSTADSSIDDPTIRRCKGFAERLGYAGIIVMNLYAFRATQPADLWKADDPIGPENDTWLAGLASAFPEVICAWGGNAKKDRIDQVIEILKSNGAKPKCLGTTKDGAPRHPLYIKNDQPMIDWEPK